MAADLVEFLRERLADDQAAASLSEAARYGIESTAGAGALELVERVPAEVEAKRRIVDEHETVPVAPGRTDTTCAGCGCAYNERPCPTLALLALPYADHPAYRQDWRPE